MTEDGHSCDADFPCLDCVFEQGERAQDWLEQNDFDAHTEGDWQ